MERITSHADLLTRSGDDPWVRWVVEDDLPTEVWVHRDVALVERVGWRRGFWVAPLRPACDAPMPDEAERVRSALTQLRDGGHLTRLRSQSVSTVQEHRAIAHQVLDLSTGGDWDWMWTTDPPPRHPVEVQVVPLDDRRDAEEINTFSARHNARIWAAAGTGRLVHWLGVRDSHGALIAVGGSEREASGAPHLAGIVTDTALRGQGLGTAVSAALTRWALVDFGACTLGMYSDNTVARRVYERLGYRTARAWHSRMLRDPLPTA
ncbi:MAG: GNAT family N-acetyltransferase [Propionibacteriaceae bacterium]